LIEDSLDGITKPSILSKFSVKTMTRLAGKNGREKPFTHHIATCCDYFYDEIATAQ
jgi:hypothetical protein